MAAAGYFLALYNYSYWSGDSTRFDEISDDKCVFCREVSKDVAHERANHYEEAGGAFSVLNASALRVNRGFYTVSIDVSQAPSEVTDRSGRTVHSAPVIANFHFDVALTHDSVWKVAEVSVEQT